MGRAWLELPIIFIISTKKGGKKMLKMLAQFMKKDDMENIQNTISTILKVIHNTNEKTNENNRMLRQLLTPAQLKKAEVI